MPIVDDFEGTIAGLTAPYTKGAAITPHDTNELAVLPRALMAFTTAGTVPVTTSGGSDITIYLPLGVPVPVRAKVVKTGGTAVGIVALW